MSDTVQVRYEISDRYMEYGTNGSWREVIILKDGTKLVHEFIWYGDQAMYAISEEK